LTEAKTCECIDGFFEKDNKCEACKASHKTCNDEEEAKECHDE